MGTGFWASGAEVIFRPRVGLATQLELALVLEGFGLQEVRGGTVQATAQADKARLQSYRFP